MILPACLPPEDPRTRLEMIKWLTVTGESLESTPIFLSRRSLLEFGIEQLIAVKADGASSLDPRLIGVRLATRHDRSTVFSAVAEAALVLTGQSDNALKCQFPVFLSQAEDRLAIRLLRMRQPSVSSPKLTAIKSDRVSNLLARTQDPESVVEIVDAYFSCLFETANMGRLLETLSTLDGMTTSDRGRMLDVMALAAIRGSATASGGHGPEAELRAQMSEWGLGRVSIGCGGWSGFLVVCRVCVL